MCSRNAGTGRGLTHSRQQRQRRQRPGTYSLIKRAADDLGLAGRTQRHAVARTVQTLTSCSLQDSGPPSALPSPARGLAHGSAGIREPRAPIRIGEIGWPNNGGLVPWLWPVPAPWRAHPWRLAGVNGLAGSAWLRAEKEAFY